MTQPDSVGYYWIKFKHREAEQIVEVFFESDKLFVFQFGENIPSEINNFTNHFDFEWLRKAK